MKIQLWSIGKPHESYVQQGIQDFTNRISKYFPVDWAIISPPKNAAVLSDSDLKKAEGIIVQNQLQKDDYLVLLDERGKQISSPELATFLQQRANQSTRNIIFFIGGAFGVDEQIFKRANYTMSLSKMVFPHMLVRLILAEQVYRACSILRNEKYHHV